MPFLRKYLFQFILIVQPFTLLSQDTNGWFSSFCPGSILNPGAAIAGISDSGSFTYNPALMAYSRINSAAISGNLYSLQNTLMKNALGTNLDLRSQSTGFTPAIASNTVTVNLKRNISLAYAILSQPLMHFSSTQRKDDVLNTLSDDYSPGKENYVGQLTKVNQLNEISGLLSVGMELGKGWAAGISISTDIRKQIFSFDFRARALINDNSAYDQRLVSVSEYYFTKNMHTGLGLRLGAAWEPGNGNHWGATLSIPRIRMLSRAEVVGDYLVSNLRIFNTDYFLFANSRQQKLPTRIRTPWNINLAYARDTKKGQLYVCAGWFAPVAEYAIVQPREAVIIRPDTGNINQYSADFLRLKDVRKPVFNLALGYRHRFNDNFTGFLGFRTDYSNADPAALKDTKGYYGFTSTWNLYHVEIGSNFKKRRFNLRTGILLSMGSTQKYTQELDLNNPSEYNFLGAQDGTIRARQFNGALMITYLYNFR